MSRANSKTFSRAKCGQKLREVATDLEIYSAEHGGHYPGRRNQVSASTCPTGGVYTVITTSDAYKLTCPRHPSPRYTSQLGLQGNSVAGPPLGPVFGCFQLTDPQQAHRIATLVAAPWHKQKAAEEVMRWGDFSIVLAADQLFPGRWRDRPGRSRGSSLQAGPRPRRA